MKKAPVPFLCFTFLLACFIKVQLYGQSRLLKIHSEHTSFPDTGRINGYDYSGTHYNFKNHYNNNNVLIAIPRNFKKGRIANLVFWFHGWRNNIDTSLVKYGLLRQFDSVPPNAILILAETAFNAPDSYPGKLSTPGEFKKLAADIMNSLKENRIVDPECRTGNIILAGHSGAYGVIASILKMGGAPVQEVYLFDALYDMADVFKNWINSNNKNRFIDVYTDSGGTNKQSMELMVSLKEMKRVPLLVEEANLSEEKLKSSGIIFIHSARPHDNIIQHPDNFYYFLHTSNFVNR